MDIATVKRKMEQIHNDPLFTFDEESHSYHYGWQKLDGATGWIHHNFVEPFDEDYHSARIAKRDGKSQEEVLAEWAAKNQASRDLGHTVHQFIEDYMQDESTPIPQGPGLFMMLEWVRWYQFTMKPIITNLIPEMRLNGLPVFANAGTADHPFWHNVHKGVKINDWKTNETFTTDDDYAFNQLKYPFHNYKENKLNIYSIQLSLYRLMLEVHDIPTIGGMITHIPRTGVPVVYKAKDFRPELRKFLNI